MESCESLRQAAAPKDAHGVPPGQTLELPPTVNHLALLHQTTQATSASIASELNYKSLHRPVQGIILGQLCWIRLQEQQYIVKPFRRLYILTLTAQ